jgi:GntR family transcriptional repressor for pyruvate dehydrogenase complex
MAAQRATEKDLERLRAALEPMKRAHVDDQPLAHSAAFHLALADASHNQVLVHMMKSFIRLIVQASSRIARSVPEAVAMEYPQHYALYEAVAMRNPEEARRRMRIHIDQAEQQLKKSLNGEKA